MIDCHVIFNKPTDREDWLQRCLTSLQHPQVRVKVHVFEESAPVRPRRYAILQAHDPSRWIMFADPDDYAVQPGYDNFVAFLQSTDADAVAPDEVVEARFGSQVTPGPHHLVALRGEALKHISHFDEGQHYYNLWGQIQRFPEPAYCWRLHGSNTGGGRS